MTKYNCIDTLTKAGISYQDATALRRISMTLHRWHELECGDGNSYGSWAIVRRHKGRTKPVEGFNATFDHDDQGKPFLEHHHYRHGNGKDYTSYTPMADREREIMACYPAFQSYVQGGALYILRPEDAAFGDDLSTHYTRGIAVYK